MNSGTVNEIASKVVSLDADSARLVDSETAIKLLDRVAALHVEDVSVVHWWSSLKSRHCAIEYGHDAAAWSHALESQMSKMEGREVFVAITDDEVGPWPIVSIEKSCLAALLSELPFFEYFFFEANCDRIVFDTHHNTIVVSDTRSMGSESGIAD